MPLASRFATMLMAQTRYAISIVANLDDSANVVGYEVFPSVIRVSRQLTYYHVNQVIEEDSDLTLIHDIACKLRRTEAAPPASGA